MGWLYADLVRKNRAIPALSVRGTRRPVLHQGFLRLRRHQQAARRDAPPLSRAHKSILYVESSICYIFLLPNKLKTAMQAWPCIAAKELSRNERLHKWGIAKCYADRYNILVAQLSAVRVPVTPVQVCRSWNLLHTVTFLTC